MNFCIDNEIFEQSVKQGNTSNIMYTFVCAIFHWKNFNDQGRFHRLLLFVK